MPLGTMFRRALSVTRRIHRNPLYDWLIAASNIIDSLTGGTQAEVRYVNKAGSDTTGDGSFAKPFLTIQAGITSITDASSVKPYTVLFAPGLYADPFDFAPWVYVRGEDQESCIISQVNANWVTAAFAAGAQRTGLSCCSLQSAFVCDWAGVAAAGAAFVVLSQISLQAGSSIAITGNAAANGFSVQDVITNALALCPITITNCGNGFVDDVDALLSAVTIQQNTDTYSTVIRIGNLSTAGIFSVLWAAGTAVNGLFVLWESAGQGSPSANVVVSGAGASFAAPLAVKQTALADGNAVLNFGVVPNTGGALIGLDAGTNVYTIAASVARTLSIGPANTDGTRIRIRNTGPGVVSLTAASSTIVGPSYIMPGGEWVAFASGAGGTWNASPQVQSGEATLTNGASGNILADITASSKITITWRTVSGAAGVPLIGTKTAGTRAGGGLFTFTSATLAAGATVATDQGTYDWHIVG